MRLLAASKLPLPLTLNVFTFKHHRLINLMGVAATSQRTIANNAGALLVSALSVVALHTVTNGEYGFHRDELSIIDDARLLGSEYVVYPPVTPFISRMSLTLFGASMMGLRFFAALAVGIVMVLTGLMARELGGRRSAAQLVAAWAAASAGGGQDSRPFGF